MEMIGHSSWPRSLFRPRPPRISLDLLQQAFKNRPELISLRLDADSAHSYATAERDLWLPTISATGSAGLTPVGADQLAPRYAAAGVNVNIPIFNGHLFGALRSEANSRAQSRRSVPSRSAKSDRSRRSHRMAEFEFRLSATRANRPAPKKFDRRVGSRPGSLQTGIKLHYRTQPSPIEPHTGRTRIGQLQIRLPDTAVGAEIPARTVAIAGRIG